MLDLDEVNFSSARDWALFALEKSKLRGFIILKSSKNCYHVLFDRYVPGEENQSMRARLWAAILLKSVSLLRYLVIQCIKRSSTLRVSPKNENHSPGIVTRNGSYGSQEHAIKDFLGYRQCARMLSRVVGVAKMPQIGLYLTEGMAHRLISEGGAENGGI